MADLERLAAAPASTEPASEPVDFPAWNRALADPRDARVSQSVFLLPLARVFAWIHVEGLEHLRNLKGPVIFAANHQSHMDVPVILAALPRQDGARRVATSDGEGIFQGALLS